MNKHRSMQYSTVKKTCPFPFPSPSLLLLSTPASMFFTLLLLSSPSLSAYLFSHHKTLYFSSFPAKIKHSHYFPQPLSLSLCPFLFHSGHSSDRHCSAVVLLCLCTHRPRLHSQLNSCPGFLKGSHPASTKPAHWE